MRRYLVVIPTLLILSLALLSLQAARSSPASPLATGKPDIEEESPEIPAGFAAESEAKVEPGNPEPDRRQDSGGPEADQRQETDGPEPDERQEPGDPEPVERQKRSGPQPGASPAGAGEVAPWAKAALLEAAVSEAMAGFPGEYSVVVHELETGQRWTYNPERLYHPASTVKVAVALYALEQYRAGQIRWDDVIQYTPADFETPGGGDLEAAPFGGWYTIENLVSRSLRYSNNIAVNMLGRHLGWQNIRNWTQTIDSQLYRAEDGTPRANALAVAGWWLHLDRLSREDPERAELLLDPLRKVAYTGRITAGLPEGVPHLHKFGSYDGNFHDSGIIYAPSPYVLVVLTHGATEGEADAAIARVSAAVYRVMAGTEE